MAELLIIIPTRSRPESLARVVEAWHETGAFADGAEPLFAYDRDDPRAPDYLEAIVALGDDAHCCRFRQVPEWRPLVPKLNRIAVEYARNGEHGVIGFAGDDHLPRTRGWARRYIETLRAAPGVVSCPDGYRPDDLPTQWAMSASVVRALGVMVPAPVEHLYCDDAVRELARAAGCYTYLPDLMIEHMHPVAGKAASDEQYERVNGRPQYRRDRTAYREWRDGGGLVADAGKVAATIRGEIG